MPTDYSVPNGLTLEDLAAVSQRLAQNPIVGVEIGEFELQGSDEGAKERTDALVAALAPLLRR